MKCRFLIFHFLKCYSELKELFMSYAGSVGKINAKLIFEDKAQVIEMGEVSVHLIAKSDSTDNRFGLFRWDMPAKAGGPAPHFHKTFSESFYVLSGHVDVYDGDRWTKTSKGDYLLVPEGGIHAFKNDSNEPASMLILFAPGLPRENFFQELKEINSSNSKLSPEAWANFYARHDQFMVA